MPIYEYRCQECGKKFEKLRRFSQSDDDILCPECGAEEIERILSAFATGGCGSGSGRFT
jgi:putative FmdB family regulatory protein